MVQSTAPARTATSARNLARPYASLGRGASSSVSTWSADGPALRPYRRHEDETANIRLAAGRDEFGGRRMHDAVVGGFVDARADVSDAGEVHHGVDTGEQRRPVDRLPVVKDGNGLDAAGNVAAPGLRVAARTGVPASASARTRARPTKPDAPVIRTRPVTAARPARTRSKARRRDTTPASKAVAPDQAIAP